MFVVKYHNRGGKLQIKGKEIHELKVIQELTVSFRSANSFDDIYNGCKIVFEKYLPYDSIIIFIFDFLENLQVKTKVGLEISIDESDSNPKKNDLLKSLFNDKTMRSFHNWKGEMELQKIFFKSPQIMSVSIIPLISKNRILGFITIGNSAKYEFSEEENRILQILSQMISYYVENLLFQEDLLKQNEVLKGITKQMRHDFANDIQSMAMAIELLTTTELSEEQEKFTRILNNSKNAAIEKLQELKRLKNKFEKKVELSLGLTIDK